MARRYSLGDAVKHNTQNGEYVITSVNKDGTAFDYLIAKTKDKDGNPIEASPPFPVMDNELQ
jgi:hypothetical protein